MSSAGITEVSQVSKSTKSYNARAFSVTALYTDSRNMICSGVIISGSAIKIVFPGVTLKALRATYDELGHVILIL